MSRRGPGWGPGKLIGHGNAGAVFAGPHGARQSTVYKLTEDPSEVRANLAALVLQNLHEELPGIPQIYDVRIGNRAAVIHRDAIGPVRATSTLMSSARRAALQRAGRLEAAGRLCNRPELAEAGRRSLVQGLRTSGLRPLAATMAQLSRLDATPRDVRAANLGRTSDGRTLQLFDLGRSPLESLVVGRGGFRASCPGEPAARAAVTEILGQAPSYKSCRIVQPRELRRVMRHHNWTDAEIDGTAGFHTPDGRILIRQGQEWSVLHEVVHGADLVDVSVAPWLAEGVTEAVAQEVARAQGWQHTPTYDREVRATYRLADTLGIPVLDLGRMIARDREALPKMAAQLCRGGRTGPWISALGPQSSGPEQFFELARRR